MANEFNPYRQFPYRGLNKTGGGLRSRSSLLNIDGVAATRLATTDTFRARPPRPFKGRAQVIKGYAAELGPPPGDENDVAFAETNTGTTLRVPWCVVRVGGGHEFLLDPARFDPAAGPENQRAHLAGAVMHQNVGVCLPDILDPAYPVPQPGDMVEVTFTDINSFSGGTYKMANATPFAAASIPPMMFFRPTGQGFFPDMNFPGAGSSAPLSPIDFAAAACDSVSNTGFPMGRRRPPNLTFGTLRGYDPPQAHLGNPDLVPPSGQYPVVEMESRTPNEFLRGTANGREFRGSIRPGFGRNRSGRIHKGEDIYIPPRAVIYAPFDGTVIRRISSSGCTSDGCDYGKVITIRSSDNPNLIIRIIHIKEVQVERAADIKAGDILGVSYYAERTRPRGRNFIAQDRFPGGDPSHIHLEAQLEDRPHEGYKGNVNPYGVVDVSLMYWPEWSSVQTVA